MWSICGAILSSCIIIILLAYVCGSCTVVLGARGDCLLLSILERLDSQEVSQMKVG
jgi:hypothetical protein